MAALDTMPSAKTVVVASFALYIIYRIGARIQLAARRRAMIRENGCQPPVDLDAFPSRQEYANRYWGIDRLFGVNIGNLQYTTEMLDQQQYYPKRMDLWNLVAPSKTCRSRMAHLTWTLTQDVENIKYVMATDFDNWAFIPGRKHGLGQFLGNGIFTSDGADWQHSRNLLKPNFTRFQVSNMGMFERHFQKMLEEIPRDGSTFDLSPLFFCLTMDAATEFLFGSSSESQGSDSTDFSDAFAFGQDHGLKILRYGTLGSKLPYPEKFKWAREVTYRFVDKFVDQALEKQKKMGPVKQDTSEKGRYVLLEELVQKTSDRLQLRSESLAVLLAGRDTTASALTTMWFILARYPDVWKKLQAEVATLNGQKPSYEQLKDMKYLQAVMNEVLRLWSPVSLNSRVALKDSVLPRGGGPDGSAPLFMAKGTLMSWVLYSYHRQKDIWGEDAEEFRPERWLGEGAMRFGWHYTPFNAGPRICLGQQFALSEVGYVTVRLCQEFADIELKGELKEWKETKSLIITHSEGATVSLKPRR